MRRGLDADKDQSYVLSVMGQSQLARTLFPVGEHHKREVREIAEELGLIVAGKKDSQDLCFLGNSDYRDFLRLHAPDVMASGPILNTAGDCLGVHQGLANYTIGQRKGVGVSSNVPLYVLAMNPYKNALVVGPREQLGRDRLVATDVNWVAGAPPAQSFRAEVKIRYRAAAQPARITVGIGQTFSVAFDEPQRDITPGQAAVIYQGDICLGGGVIAQVCRKRVRL